MELKEAVKLTQVKLSKSISYINSLKKGSFKNFKVSIYELGNSLKELEKIIFEEEDERFLNLIKTDRTFQDLLNYFEKELRGISDKEFENNPEIYLNLIKEELVPKLNYLQVILTKVNSFFVKISKIKIIYLKSYLADKNNNTYQQNIKIIEKVENRIIDYFASGGLPGKSHLAKIDKDALGEKLHSHLPNPIGNHRIVYTFDSETKTIIFERIVPKKLIS